MLCCSVCVCLNDDAVIDRRQDYELGEAREREKRAVPSLFCSRRAAISMAAVPSRAARFRWLLTLGGNVPEMTGLWRLDSRNDRVSL